MPVSGTSKEGLDIVVHEVIREARAGALIELTDKLATVALEPLTRSTAATLEELAQEVARIAGAVKHT
jgi:hypothetical protein